MWPDSETEPRAREQKVITDHVHRLRPISHRLPRTACSPQPDLPARRAERSDTGPCRAIESGTGAERTHAVHRLSARAPHVRLILYLKCESQSRDAAFSVA